MGRQESVEIRDAADREGATRERIEYIPCNDTVDGNDAAFTRELCFGHNRGNFEWQAIAARSCMPALPTSMERAVADRNAPYMLRHLVKQEIDSLLPKNASLGLLA